MSRLAVAAVAFGFAALGAATGIGSRPVVASDAVHRVGTLQLGPCQDQGWTLDPSLHVLVVEETTSGAAGCSIPAGAPAILELFSTSTLKRLAVVPITQASAFDRLDVDSVHHRLFLLTSSSSAALTNDYVYTYAIPRLLSSTGMVSPDATATLSPDAIVLGGAGSVGAGNLTGSSGDASLHFSGSRYEPGADQLYVTLYENVAGINAVSSQNGPGADDVYLADIDLHSGSVRWAQVLDSCVYDTSSTSLFHVGGRSGLPDPVLVRDVPGGSEVEVGCAYSRSPGLVPDSQQSGAGGIVPGLTSGSMLTYRVPLDATGAPVAGSITYALGRTHSYGGVADPAEGRIFWAAAPVNDYQSISTSSSGASAVVYDAAQAVYDGAITISSAAAADGGFQLAPANHRLYSVGPDGILVDGASATPPGQGVWFSAYSCATADLSVDPALRRLLILPFSQCDSNKVAPATTVQVYQDDYQLAPPAVPPDPDGYTLQIPERAGVTGSQYNGHAEATGSRFRLIGGIHGAVSGGTFSLYDQSFGAAGDLAQEGGATPPPDAVPADYASHEIDLASASKADLGNYQAAADGIAADADSATRAQLQNSNSAWPFSPTSCSDPGSAQAQQQYAGDTGSTATCHIGSQAATTSAAGPVTVTLYVAGQGQTSQLVPMPVGLGANLSSGTVSIDPVKGLVSTASSQVKDLTLSLPGAGELRIDGITLTISCHAHGRSGTAGCTATRVLNGVTYAGSPVDGGSCTDTPGVDTCGQLLAALNRIRPGILVFQMPAPDRRADYFNGSPGGYEAIGQRELYEHLQDKVLNYDDSEQVPGLQVTYVNDSISTPSRLDLQLGDVEAEAYYGITNESSTCSACDAAPATSGPALTVPGAQTAHTLPEPTAQPAAGGLGKILQRVWDGIRVLLRSPAAAAAATALLLMLVSPLLMGMRRRRLELLVQEVPS